MDPLVERIYHACARNRIPFRRSSEPYPRRCRSCFLVTTR
jgi:hypothetical protein